MIKLEVPMPYVCPNLRSLFSRTGLKFSSLLALILLTLLLMISGEAYAATYYIAPDGDNTGPGTSSAPWATFAYAMLVLQPGDTLYLEDGTYSEQLNITASGTSNAYVTIRARNEGSAIVSTTYPESPLTVNNESYIEVDGINFRNSGVYDKSVNCATDGLGYTDINGVDIKYSDHIILRRVTSNGCSGCNSAVISLWYVTNSLLEDCAGSGQGRVVLNMLDCSNLTIRRCWLDWTGPSTGGGDTPNVTQVYDSSNVLMENNIGVHTASNNVAFFNTWGHYSSISGNKFYGNIGYNSNGLAAGGMFQDSADCGYVVSGTVFLNNVAILNGGGGQAAMEINADPNNGTVFANNTFASPNSSGGGLLLKYSQSACSGQSAAVANVSSNSFLNTSSGLEGNSSTPSNYIDAHDYNNFYNMYDGDGPLYETAFIIPGYLNTNESQINPGYPASTYGYGAYLMAPEALKGRGANGSNIGANVIYEYVDGTLTDAPLWPWPMENRIVAEFGISPTYADDGNGHTGGFWNTLTGVYGSSTDATPPRRHIPRIIK